MKVLILTAGTRGDVQPYVALGRGLLDAGHYVTIGTRLHFEPFVREHGLDYVYIDNDLIDLLHSEEGVMAMENMSNLFEALGLAIEMIPKTCAMAERQIRNVRSPVSPWFNQSLPQWVRPI